MATVFLARLEGVAGFQRLFAIKRLHPHLAKEAEFVDMFLDEARLAARIHHPNVVPILEVGTSAEGYYLVMEYIEGDTAARLLARAAQGGKNLPPAAAVRIALDTLNGLHAAHDLTDDEGRPLHIVHRDVSPQNVLVGVDGSSRITDFGVAHAVTRLSSTRTGQLKGKLAYMAPEQARGAVVDRRADVFALGVVLWEMLAGKRLFKASNDAETLHRILFAPMPTVRGSGVDIPIPLDTVVMKALEREQETRYASAAEFSDELERVARSLGMLATTRDIAAYVDTTIGAEISQQRDVVRMWLSRSEPSHGLHKMSIAAVPEDLRALRGASGGGLPRMGPRDPMTTPSKPGGVPISENRTEVSSVSSAVLEVGEATTTDSRVLFPGGTPLVFDGARRRKRRLAIVGAASAGVALLLLVGFLLPGSSRHPSAAARPTSASPSAAVPSERPTSAQAETAAPPPATAASVASPVASSASAVAGATTTAPSTPSPHAATTNAPAGARPAHPAVAPTAKPAHGAHGATPTPDDPDDLSRNPYR
jgi:serine/threonine protein kinase